MSHQPFETWLLDDDGTLSPAERRALQEHLASCPQCQRLEQKWQATRQELHMRRMVAPAPGFTQRWQNSLAERKAQEQRRNAWKIFGITSIIALLTLVVLTSYTLATTSPAEWLGALVQTISSTNAFSQYAIYVIQNWLSITPPVIPIVLWIYVTITLCFLIFIWVAVLWRTKYKGAINA